MAKIITANGDTPFNVPAGAAFSLVINGTYDGATVKIQYSQDDAWVDYGDEGTTTAESSGIVLDQIGDSDKVNLNVAGGTSPSLKVNLNVIRQ